MYNKGIFEKDIETIYNQLFNEQGGDLDKMSKKIFVMCNELEKKQNDSEFYNEKQYDEYHKNIIIYALVKCRIINEKLKKTMSNYKR